MAPPNINSSGITCWLKHVKNPPTMQEAQACTDGLLTGDLNNLHEMSIASAKSEVMLHLTTQIASKLCTSATTLFQMQL